MTHVKICISSSLFYSFPLSFYADLSVCKMCLMLVLLAGYNGCLCTLSIPKFL